MRLKGVGRFLGLLICDVIGVNLMVYLSFLLAFNFTEIPQRNLEAWLHVWWGVVGVKILVFQLAGLYDSPEEQTGLGLLLLSFWGSILATVGIMALAFLSRDFAFPRSVILINTVLSALFLWVSRIVVLVLVRKTMKPMRLLCVGIPIQESWHKIGAKFVEEISNSEASLQKLFQHEQAGERVVLVTTRENPRLKEWLKGGLIDKENWSVLLAPEVSDCMIGLGHPQVLGDIPLMPLRAVPMNLRLAGMKRSLDLLVAIPMLIFLGLILIPLSPILWITQGMGLFYKQIRVGLNGQEFPVLKLRTMRRDSEAKSGPVLAAGAADPRVTPLGFWLRLSKLDEMPQFWNVLLGQMSVVGPRPERPVFVKQFMEEIPLYHERHRVRPGVTGMSQVYGRYHTTAETKLKFDLLYAYNYSLMVDIRLMVDTVKIVLLRLARKET